MKRLLLVVVVLAAAFAVPAADAATAPHAHVVVWSGGFDVGETSVGAELLANGSGHRLVADANGKTRVAGSFAARGARLRAIRVAAADVLAHAPAVTRDARIQDGDWVTVSVELGKHRKLVLDVNADSPSVAALLAALNAALPRSARVASAGLPRVGASRLLAHAAARSPQPSTADCANGDSPIHVTKSLSLQEGVAAGVVTGVKAKGVAGGDAVAFNAQWVPDVAAPAAIDVNLEVSTNIPGMTDEQAYNTAYNAVHDGGLMHTSVDGEDVDINVNLRSRPAGAPPSPCYHQVLLTDDRQANGAPARSAALAGRNAIGAVDPYSPGSFVLVRNDHMSGTFAHELSHLLGNGDHYSDWVHPIGEPRESDFRLPMNGMDGAGLDALLAVLGYDRDNVILYSKPDSDAEADDIMADETDPHSHFTEDELRDLIAGAALAINAKPGTVLVDKDGSGQSLGIGALLQLVLGAGQRVHQDGIVAYCLDLLGRTTPTPGDTLDVLPTAGELGLPTLQRVLEIVAAREPGPLEETPGANLAIWRVTDNIEIEPDGDPAAVSILEAAGVPLDPAAQTFDEPDYVDPAAANPESVALASPTNPTPVPSPVRSPAVPPPPGSKLTALRIESQRVARGTAFLVARVTLAGPPDRVSLALTRQLHHRTVTVARGRAHALRAGQAPLVLVVPHLKPGRYVLLARGSHSTSCSRAAATAGRCRRT